MKNIYLAILICTMMISSCANGNEFSVAYSEEQKLIIDYSDLQIDLYIFTLSNRSSLNKHFAINNSIDLAEICSEQEVNNKNEVIIEFSSKICNLQERHFEITGNNNFDIILRERIFDLLSIPFQNTVQTRQDCIAIFEAVYQACQNFGLSEILYGIEDEFGSTMIPGESPFEIYNANDSCYTDAYDAYIECMR